MLLKCISHHFFSHPITSPYTKLGLKGTFTTLLNLSSSRPTQLKQIHALLLTTGIHVKNSLLTKLIESLTQLGNMVYAHQLFDEMHKPRSYLWTTLIRGYVKNEFFRDAMLLYVKMRRVGVSPDSFTFPWVVKGCGGMESVVVGEEVHGHLVKFGVEFDVIVRTELMCFYVKFGDVEKADYLFESMVDKDLASWNALISVYQQNGHADKALRLFRRMEGCNVKPDLVTLVSALSACAHLGCLDVGREIGRIIVEEGIENNIVVNNALLDLYAKCGDMVAARSLFDEMSKRNVISWSTMIGGYAMNGESEKALCLFSRMQTEKVKPNHVTYLALLSACSHGGLIDEGKRYFKYMVSSNDDNIRPKLQHYTCMVDLLGRSGHLEVAYNFIKNMPIEPDSGVWGALLNACTIHQSTELGQHVADTLFGLAPDTGAYSVLLSNIYAAAGRWRDVEIVRRRMRRKSVHREAGYSSVESNGEICVFFYGANQSHPLSADIYAVLEDLNKKVGDKLF